MNIDIVQWIIILFVTFEAKIRLESDGTLFLLLYILVSNRSPLATRRSLLINIHEITSSITAIAWALSKKWRWLRSFQSQRGPRLRSKEVLYRMCKEQNMPKGNTEGKHSRN